MNKIPYDKKLHFAAGLGISLIVGIITKPLFGLAAGAVAGVAKEVYDYTDYGKFDPMDMLATWVGAIVGFGIVYGLHFL